MLVESGRAGGGEEGRRGESDCDVRHWGGLADPQTSLLSWGASLPGPPVLQCVEHGRARHDTCTMIIVHACTMMIVHACTMIIAHPRTMIIVHAGTITYCVHVLRSCTTIIVHACTTV